MFYFCNEKTPHLCGFQVFRKHLVEVKWKGYGKYDDKQDAF